MTKRDKAVATSSVSFPQSEVLALCAEYGPDLHVDVSQPQLTGRYIMAAFAMNESSLGADCTPRHEPSWDVGGIYATNLHQAELLREYGSAAACSYGIWQLMLYNCLDYSPAQLNSDADAGAQCFLAYFNGYMQKKGGVTLEQLGQIYNFGHVTEDPPEPVQQYTQKLQAYYQTVQALF
jgi:hypothetical protein